MNSDIQESGDIRDTKTQIQETAEERGWELSVGVGLVDVRKRIRGVIVTVPAALENEVRGWLAEHPQEVAVEIRTIDSIRAR